MDYGVLERGIPTPGMARSRVIPPGLIITASNSGLPCGIAHFRLITHIVLAPLTITGYTMSRPG